MLIEIAPRKSIARFSPVTLTLGTSHSRDEGCRHA
jgi:hypothetical protein